MEAKKPTKRRLYAPVELSAQMQSAITKFGEKPTKANREALERLIKRYAYRRKYDGEFLTAGRSSRNTRSPKHGI